jgi:hypothetical protein
MNQESNCVFDDTRQDGVDLSRKQIQSLWQERGSQDNQETVADAVEQKNFAIRQSIRTTTIRAASAIYRVDEMHLSFV